MRLTGLAAVLGAAVAATAGVSAAAATSASAVPVVDAPVSVMATHWEGPFGDFDTCNATRNFYLAIGKAHFAGDCYYWWPDHPPFPGAPAGFYFQYTD
jgi:hypothetical protein